MMGLIATLDGQINLQALSAALNLPLGACAELADIDPQSGDYRAFYIGLMALEDGDIHLLFELHRRSPNQPHWVFELLSLQMSPPDPQGLCCIKTFTADGPISQDDLPRLLPLLSEITAALQQGLKPAGSLLRPFFSNAAQHLWADRLAEAVL